MLNVKEIYNKLLNDSSITSLIPEENILSAWPSEVEVFPCIIFLDDFQSDAEYYDNKPGASSCSVAIHIFTKKLEGYVSTSEIGIQISKVMNNDFWNCSTNKEVIDPDEDVEHRAMIFSKSIFYWT